MVQLLAFLQEFGPFLAGGVSAILALGALLVALFHSPAHRRQIGELTLLGAAIWILLVLLPLPRLLPQPGSPSTRKLTVIPQVASLIGSPQELSHLESEIALEELAPSQPVSLAPGPRQTTVLDSPRLPATSSSDAADDEAMLPSMSERASTRVVETGESKLAFVLALAFLGGSMLALAWILLGQLLLLRIRWWSESPAPWLVDLFDTLRKDSRLSARLLVSTQVRRPIAWGVVAPVIVLPQALCRRGNEISLRTILFHELSHIQHRDARANLLLTASLPGLYWNPVYWWLRQQMNLAAELVADDWAAERTGKEEYVEQLVALANSLRGGEMPLLGAIGVFSVPSQFFRRMEMLLARETSLDRPTTTWSWSAIGACLLLVSGVGVVAGVRPLPAQDPAPAAGLAMPPKAENKDVAPATAPAGAPVTETTPAPAAGTNRFPPDGRPALPPADLKPSPISTPETAGPGDQAETLERYRAKTQAEKQRLLQTIKMLEDRLQALEQARAAAPGKSSTAAELPPGADAHREAESKPSAITLVRRDESGKLYYESWTVDAHGRLNKLLDRSEVKVNSGAAPGAPIPEGVRKTPLLPTITLPAAAPAPTVVEHPAPRGVIADSTPTGSARQLDLVNLATSYADALGALDVAKSRLTELEPLAQSNAVSQQEVNSARVALASAQRKESILKRIAESALKSAKQEVEYATKHYQAGIAPAGAALEAHGRVEILQQILGSPGEDPAKAPGR